MKASIIASRFVVGLLLVAPLWVVATHYVTYRLVADVVANVARHLVTGTICYVRDAAKAAYAYVETTTRESRVAFAAKVTEWKEEIVGLYADGVRIVKESEFVEIVAEGSKATRDYVGKVATKVAAMPAVISMGKAADQAGVVVKSAYASVCGTASKVYATVSKATADAASWVSAKASHAYAWATKSATTATTAVATGVAATVETVDNFVVRTTSDAMAWAFTNKAMATDSKVAVTASVLLSAALLFV